MVNKQENEMSEESNGVYKIPADNLPKFEKQIAKLSRKSEKLGCGRIYFIPFNTLEEKQKNGTVIRFVEILFNGFESPKLNGWSFVARLDHSSDAGNIVRPIPGHAVPEKYRTVGSDCDHCNRKRYRRDTFVVRNEAGEYKQVGGTCLKDFLGHGEPEKLAKMAELLGYADEYARGAMSIGRDRKYLDLEVFLMTCAAVIEKHGYMSRSNAMKINQHRQDGNFVDTTAGLALDSMFYELGDHKEIFYPEDKHRALAIEAMEWAQALGEDGKELSDYEHNIHVLAATGYIEFRSVNYASSIIAGYMRKNNLLPQPERKVSAHVGKVGDKLELDLTLLGTFPRETARGMSYFYRFADKDGNVFTWGTGIYIDLEKGEKIHIGGKVKAHDEFKSMKSTALSHCKFEIPA
jgi:hypothetical protein